MVQILIFTHVKDEAACEIILFKLGPKWMKITNHFQWQNSHHEQNITHTQWSSKCKERPTHNRIGLTSRFSNFSQCQMILISTLHHTLLSISPSFSAWNSQAHRAWNRLVAVTLVYLVFVSSSSFFLQSLSLSLLHQICRQSMSKVSTSIFICLPAE